MKNVSSLGKNNTFQWPWKWFYDHGDRTVLIKKIVQVLLVIFGSTGIGLAVIVSTHMVDNPKLLVGILGGIVFFLLTMKWPELGILFLIALESGLISLSWLPILHLGPISLNIADVILLMLLALVFLRITSLRGFTFYRSPLFLPLLLFIGAFLLSAANAILIYGVGFNTVLRTVRILGLWIVFIPILQLVRDEKALRRLLNGLLVFSGFLLMGVVFPNAFYPFLYIQERIAGTGTEIYSGFTRVYYAGDMILYAMIPTTIASLAIIKSGKQYWRIAMLGLLLYWVFRTFFRQYWLTLFVTCFLLIIILSQKERFRLMKRITPAIIISILVVVALAAAQPDQVERIFYIASDRIGSLLNDPIKNENSLQWRVIETNYALRQIERHPVLGLGIGNSYRPPMESEGAMYGGWANKYIENGYLYIAVMMGMVGLIPFLWLCGAYLLRILRNQHKIHDESLRAIYLGFGFSFLGMMACNVATPTFVDGTRLIFFPASMAICEIILRISLEKAAIS